MMLVWGDWDGREAMAEASKAPLAQQAAWRCCSRWSGHMLAVAGRLGWLELLVMMGLASTQLPGSILFSGDGGWKSREATEKAKLSSDYGQCVSWRACRPIVKLRLQGRRSNNPGHNLEGALEHKPK